MVNYRNGKIYRIDCLITNKVYIGATTHPTLAKRLAEHVSSLKKWKNGKCNFVTSFQIIEQGNYKMTLIESYPCNSKDELSAREGYFIRTMECVNKVIPNRTKEEYYEDHKEVIIERSKKRYEEHRGVISEQKKIHYEEHKEIILEQHKIYRDENREKIRERDRKFLKENKDRISEKRKAPYTCICGRTICISEKARHERSAFHIKNIPVI